MNAKFIVETPQGAEPIPPAVPLIQPMFRQGVRDTTSQFGSTIIRKNLFSRDLRIGSNSQ